MKVIHKVPINLIDEVEEKEGFPEYSEYVIMQKNDLYLNTDNSDIRILDETEISYLDKIWINFNLLEKIIVIKNKYKTIRKQILKVDSDNKIKVDDPKLYQQINVLTPYIWFFTKEACLTMIDGIRDSSLSITKKEAKKRIIAFFEKEEKNLKYPYLHAIDICSSGGIVLHLLSEGADSSVLRKVLKDDSVKHFLDGLDEYTIKVVVDKTNRRKI